MKDNSSENWPMINYDVPAAAKEIGVRASTLYAWIRAGIIPLTTRHDGELRIKNVIVKIAKAAYKHYGKNEWLKHVSWTEEVKDSPVQLSLNEAREMADLKNVSFGQVNIKRPSPDVKKIARAAECLYEQGHQEVALMLSMSLVEKIA